MKKFLLLAFCLFLFFPSVESASYYNEDYDEDNYYYFDHFYIRKVKAKRAIQTSSGLGALGDALTEEEEDWWQIHYSFDVDVTDFEMRWDALDGQNDHDTRSYTDKRDEREADEHYDLKHGNFPTYVDNMEVRVKYTYGGHEYYHHFYIVVEGGYSDRGSRPLAIREDEIPENEIDTDDGGTWGEGGSIESTFEDVNPFSKMDFGWLDELPEKIINFFISLLLGILLIKFSIVIIGHMSVGSIIGGGILLLLGIFFIVGAFSIIFGIVENFLSLLNTILNGLKKLNPL